jgi:hypothetical protein
VDVGLDADYERAELEIVADLTTADEAIFIISVPGSQGARDAAKGGSKRSSGYEDPVLLLLSRQPQPAFAPT